MDNGMLTNYLSRTHSSFVKENSQVKKPERPKGFKEQILELAKDKSPREMTLAEYREYIKEKIEKTVLPVAGMSVIGSVCISDMALVAMKFDPECEKEVLKGLRFKLMEKGGEEVVRIDLQIIRARERRTKRKREQQYFFIKKKQIEILYEMKAERREAYTEFLETGKRYATPCPAAEFFAAGCCTRIPKSVCE